MTSLSISRIGADVGASPQVAPADLAAVAAAGYRSVVNNRPDHEGPGQPTSAEIEAGARAAGLAYAYLPVQPAVQTPADAAALAELLATLPKPVLLFCRSGARSTRLFNLSLSV